MRGQREMERERQKIFGVVTSSFCREGGRGKGGSEALPVEDKETGRGLKHSAFAFPLKSVHTPIVKGKSI